MKQILMTLMASCPFSVRWDQCWGLNEDGARVPCPYPPGAPHILGIARVAEVTNIHPSTFIHIYACAYKCTHVFACVINTTHVFTRAWVHECDMRFQLHTSMCIYVYICSHMHQNVLVTTHTIQIYIYIYITRITPVCHGWIEPTFGWLYCSVFGRKTGSGLNGRRWGFTEDGGFQWWICLKHDFQSFKKQRDPKIWRYQLNISWMWSCLKVILFFTIYHLPPNLMKMSSGATVDRSSNCFFCGSSS